MQRLLQTLAAICTLIAYAVEAAPLQPAAATTIDRTLSISYTEFPPYTYTSDSGVAKGYFVDLIAGMLNELQISHTFISTPTPRIHYQLKSGELDVYLGPRGVPGLRPHIWITPIPETFSIKLRLWRRPGTPNRENLDALRNQSLAIINGFGYGGLAKELNTPGHGINIFNARNHDKAIKMLISGRVDYLLDYQRPIHIELAKHPDITLHSHPILNIPVAFMVSRRAQQGEQIHRALQTAVENHFSHSEIPRSLMLPKLPDS